MSLPFLEFLNLSYNEIENIEPVAKLKSPNLKYIFLQRNKIEDIEPFLQSYFPVLKILRVEGNNIYEENEWEEKKKMKKEIFNKIMNKFSEKFIYKSLKEQLIVFNKRYNSGIYKYFSKSNQNNEINIPEEEKIEEFQLIIEDENENKIDIDRDKNNNEISEKDVENIVKNIVKIDLYDKKGGDKMLKYLFLIITYASENKIKKLILRNNDIKDASMLARINFSQLKMLDLSVNEIEDSNFLTDLKADNLENLYLGNNHFKNFCPILNIDINEILNSKILNKIEEKDFKNLYKESEENRSKGIKPLLIDKFKKLKTLAVNNNVDVLNINKVVEDLDASGNITPDNIFICPECGEINPEISQINVDNKIIEFYCKRCGEREYNSKYFYKELHDNIFYYYLKPKYINRESQYWFKEYRNINKRALIEKSLFKKIFQNKLQNAKEIIKNKNEQLKEIIKFNQIIIETSSKYQNNYFHLKSLKNISISLKKEALRDSNDLKFLFAGFNNEIKISDKAIEVFNKVSKVDIKREEESLFLSKKNLNDINIISLSMIKFNQLKEIDLSENEIRDIEPISKMSLPFLEFLNLSFNRINNIKPLGEINSKKLKYLFIQNNQIEDIQYIKYWDFPKLKILRLENNNIRENSVSFKEILMDYLKIKHIIVTKKKIEEIENLYNIQYDENTKKIELEGVKEDEDEDEDELILMNLFIIISQKNENRIRRLKLTRNKIKNPSILNRIQFNFLEELDLSLNKITNLKFLKGIKAKNLKEIYLNNNYIKDLSPLYNIKEYFPFLKCINLHNNNFNPEEPQFNNLAHYLGKKDIKFIC